MKAKINAIPRTRTPRGPSLTQSRIIMEMPDLVAVAKATLAQMRADSQHATGSDDVAPLLYLVGKMAGKRPALDAQGDLVKPPTGGA
jgi:hypothetical protein